MDNENPIIIAIASISGGGKTTITSHLNRILPNSKAIYFDDFEFDGLDDLCNWVERGADYNEWNLTPLIIDLKFVLYNQLKPLDFILLDYPFAYKHSGMSELID